jgi:hypothetical protein
MVRRAKKAIRRARQRKTKDSMAAMNRAFMNGMKKND